MVRLVQQRLTLSMIVRNEADRYLPQVLRHAREYITDAVIVDDGSTDSTPDVCEELLKGLPLKLVRNGQTKFDNEWELRRQQWNEIYATNPEWILPLDADEMFEDLFSEVVPSMLQKTHVEAYYFRLYDFWSESEYRDDSFWCAHKYYRPFLLRWPAERLRIAPSEVSWKQTPQHCGRLPLEVSLLAYECSPLRLRHFGWARAEDRQAKYDRYKRLDPDGVYGWPAQYESILDPNPNLVKWQ